MSDTIRGPARASRSVFATRVPAASNTCSLPWLATWSLPSVPTASALGPMVRFIALPAWNTSARQPSMPRIARAATRLRMCAIAPRILSGGSRP